MGNLLSMRAAMVLSMCMFCAKCACSSEKYAANPWIDTQSYIYLIIPLGVEFMALSVNVKGHDACQSRKYGIWLYAFQYNGY